MAEVAAGALAVEQVISTGLQVGAAATVAKPTQPLTAVLTQIARTPEEDDSLSLARSHHSVTVINGKAYIFGGKKDNGKLCNNDVHAVAIPGGNQVQGQGEYACYPAVGDEGHIPPPRINHAACARRDTLIVFGGQNEEGHEADDEFTLWEWEPKAARWSAIEAAGKAPQSRHSHQIFYDAKKDNLILHGGYENEQRSTGTWLLTSQPVYGTFYQMRRLHLSLHSSSKVLCTPSAPSRTFMDQFTTSRLVSSRTSHLTNSPSGQRSTSPLTLLSLVLDHV
ncbi:hypothetical protein SNK04_005509 [Fusarium graminearum]